MNLLWKLTLVCIAGISTVSPIVSLSLQGLPAQSMNPPPNIILLLTDDQRWDTLGVNGNRIIHTPNLDELAHRGVVFDNMFVTTSICATSRASILTGQYARRHGIWDFQSQLSPRQLERSYLGRLKKAGYYLGFIGKWGVGTPPQAYFDFDRTFPGQGNYRVEAGGIVRHLTSVMGDQAIEFLDGVPRTRPFCLSVSFKAAHVQDSYDLSKDPFPYDPALQELYGGVTIPPPPTPPLAFQMLPRFLQDSENRMRWAVRFWGPSRFQESVKGYYRLISGVDRVVGRLLSGLRDRGLDGNTIIIFTSDNGFFLGELGLAGKWTPHEVSIRVPLIVFDPHLPEEKRGRRLPEMVLNIDIAPTIVEMAGLMANEHMQGRSITPLLRLKTSEWRREFFYEHLFKHPRIPRVEAIRTAEWKYVRYLDIDPPFEELYNLSEDPWEQRNQAGEPGMQDRLDSMRAQWLAWREAAK